MRDGDLSLNDVLDAVAAHFVMSREELVSGRSANVLQIAKYLACRVTRCSLNQIGSALGGVGSTNVMYAFRKVAREMQQDSSVDAEIEALRKRILSGA